MDSGDEFFLIEAFLIEALDEPLLSSIPPAGAINLLPPKALDRAEEL